MRKESEWSSDRAVYSRASSPRGLAVDWVSSSTNTLRESTQVAAPTAARCGSAARRRRLLQKPTAIRPHRIVYLYSYTRGHTARPFVEIDAQRSCYSTDSSARRSLGAGVRRIAQCLWLMPWPSRSQSSPKMT